jgi:hypothetical protein
VQGGKVAEWQGGEGLVSGQKLVRGRFWVWLVCTAMGWKTAVMLNYSVFHVDGSSQAIDMNTVQIAYYFWW